MGLTGLAGAGAAVFTGAAGAAAFLVGTTFFVGAVGFSFGGGGGGGGGRLCCLPLRFLAC